MRLPWFSWLILALVALLAASCKPAIPAPVADSTAAFPGPPTEAPTVAPLPTLTIVTPPPAYATQETARRATVIARATVSPFPTAGPATVQTGQPASATARRDGLTFQARLPKDTYLADEAGRAEITLCNDGSETVFIYGYGQHAAQLVLLDERGHEPAPWPWWPMIFPAPPYLRELAPGQALTDTLTFQVPPEEQAAVHAYVLWAETRFSRPAPDNPQSPDNLWLHLETWPIPLQVTPPEPAQRLIAELQADGIGWQLQVVDANGQIPVGPLWGVLEAASPNGAYTRPLQDTTDGTWSAAWDSHLIEDEAQVIVRAWVAAPGYATAAITQTVPGEGDARLMFGTWEPPERQTFATLEAAQATLDSPLYRLGQLPAGATLAGVQVETRADRDRRWMDVIQTYRLSDGDWLELTQMTTTEPYASFGWGQARYAPEARSAMVGPTTGYVVQRFGWWVLDWKLDDVGLELRSPTQALSLEDLLAIAASIEPLRRDVLSRHPHIPRHLFVGQSLVWRHAAPSSGVIQ
jgi:hypothetical protein